MPRAIWSGAISFGLVSIPVKLYPAVSRKSVRFNQLDGRTMQRVKQKRVNTDGDEVPYDEIVKGYEVMKDSYVVITDEELSSVSPKASRTIDIVDFVDAADIDPVFYDSGYYLVPDELARKSYALLAQAMTDDGRVAIASFHNENKTILGSGPPDRRQTHALHHGVRGRNRGRGRNPGTRRSRRTRSFRCREGHGPSADRQPLCQL